MDWKARLMEKSARHGWLLNVDIVIPWAHLLPSDTLHTGNIQSQGVLVFSEMMTIEVFLHQQT